jgi:hypothetical protein
MQLQSRSLTVRCSPESGETIERIAALLGWSQNKIASHLIERAVPLLRAACNEEDLVAIIRILRASEFSVAEGKLGPVRGDTSACSGKQ